MNNKWYILYNGQQIGPMTEEQLCSYNPTPDTQVWCQGMPQWAPIYTIPELMSIINTYRRHAHPNGQNHSDGSNSTPPPSDNFYQPASVKDHTTAGIFALLLGGLGIQYFYIGKTTGGIFCILLSMFTCGLFGILVMVQGIMMLTMTQQEFERKYVNSTSAMPLF